VRDDHVTDNAEDAGEENECHHEHRCPSCSLTTSHVGMVSGRDLASGW
jgi:hypothetical protein